MPLRLLPVHPSKDLQCNRGLLLGHPRRLHTTAATNTGAVAARDTVSIAHAVAAAHAVASVDATATAPVADDHDNDDGVGH